MVLELEEDDEEEEEEEEVVTRYNGRLSRFSSPRQQPVDDFDDDDEDEEDLPPARTVFSSKFGEMRFGEGFRTSTGAAPPAGPESEGSGPLAASHGPATGLYKA